MLDSGPLIALYDRDDPRGPEVQGILDSAAGQEYPLCISDLVIAETHRRLLYDVNYDAALAFIQHTHRDLARGEINLLTVGPADRAEAISILQRFSDQNLPFCDAMTMALMKREGILKVLTFDRHFWLLNFRVLP